MAGRFTSATALGAFMRKEVRHLLRDRQTLTILLLLPIAQLLLFGFAVRTDISQVRVALVAPQPDAVTAALRTRFAHSGRFRLLPPIVHPDSLDALFRSGQADVGVVLEPGLASRLSAGVPTEVLVVAAVPVPVVAAPRGVKLTGTLMPAVPPLASVAAKSRVRVVFASMIITSITTSDLGLSRSCTSFSASDSIDFNSLESGLVSGGISNNRA